MVFGTTGNTYTAGGVTSAASKSAQSGTTVLLTSDSAGNLATTDATALMDAVASGANATAFGVDSTASGSNSSAFGQNSTASGTGASTFGFNSSALQANASAFGNGASASNSGASAFGNGAHASGTDSSAFGISATASATDASAFGRGAAAALNGSTAIGANATTTRANQIALGTNNNTYTAAGITSLTSRAAQNGTTQIVTSDSAGNLATTDTNELVTGNSAFQDLQADVRDNSEGVAMALAMAGTASVLPDNKAVAVSANYGAFEGESAGAFSGVARVQGDLFLNAGIGFSTHTSGGRAGLTFAW